MTIQLPPIVAANVPRTKRQCKKLYKQLLKSAVDAGKVSDVYNALVGENDWCKKLEELIERLQNEEHVQRDV